MSPVARSGDTGLCLQPRVSVQTAAQHLAVRIQIEGGWGFFCYIRYSIVVHSLSWVWFAA